MMPEQARPSLADALCLQNAARGYFGVVRKAASDENPAHHDRHKAERLEAAIELVDELAPFRHAPAEEPRAFGEECFMEEAKRPEVLIVDGRVLVLALPEIHAYGAGHVLDLDRLMAELEARQEGAGDGPEMAEPAPPAGTAKKPRAGLPGHRVKH